MIEEYVKETHELISWIWKKKDGFKSEEIIEIGLPKDEKSELISLNNSNPVFTR